MRCKIVELLPSSFYHVAVLALTSILISMALHIALYFREMEHTINTCSSKTASHEEPARLYFFLYRETHILKWYMTEAWNEPMAFQELLYPNLQSSGQPLP